jgi:hypothetical protein
MPASRHQDHTTLPVGQINFRKEADQTLYSITVPLEAGFGKDALHFRDMWRLAESVASKWCSDKQVTVACGVWLSLVLL